MEQMSNKLYKIECYVPETHLEQVKSALFAAGAGRVGDYDCCAWQTAGTGQFKPLAGSTPFIGELNEVASVAEYKVELVCAKDNLSAALQAMISAHPYQEPAFSVLALVDY